MCVMFRWTAVPEQELAAKTSVCSHSHVPPPPEQHHLSSGAWLFPEPGSVVGAGSEWEPDPPSHC